MSRSRFDGDKLVSIPAGALAALVNLAESTFEGAEQGPVYADAIHEAQQCACTQGVDLVMPKSDQNPEEPSLSETVQKIRELPWGRSKRNDEP
jgi:hypothetical protein